MESNLIDRRTLIVGSFAATLLPATFGGTPVFAEEVADQNIDKSNNGWPIQNPDSIVSTIKNCNISGLGASYQIVIGNVDNILSDFIRQIHYNIKYIAPNDVVGWQLMLESFVGTPYSNLSSGTAFQIRPSMTIDSYFPYEIDMIRNLLSDYSGVNAWGGDLEIQDESLFYLNVSPFDPLFLSVSEKIRERNLADKRIN